MSSLSKEEIDAIMAEPASGRSRPSKGKGDVVAMVRKVCSTKGSPEPAEYLARVMSGEDPRPGQSELVNLIEEIGAAPPDEAAWDELRMLILSEYREQPVTLDASTKAAERLMGYIHPQLKALDVNQKSLNAHVGSITLTKESLELFESWFFDEF